jgi:ABC-2 type transport system ATP-binding protein
MHDAENSSQAGAAIRAVGVSFTYPGGRRRQPAPAVRDVNFAVEAGETAALLGPNGSGKSTLFKMLCGLLEPDRGEIQLGDEPGAIDPHALGIVFQSPVLDPHLTVRENLESHAALRGLGRAECEREVEAGMVAAGLAELAQRRAKRLSGGQRRRVDLLRALLHQPSVLLLDEPTVGLDPSARADFLERIDALHRERRITILMSTHMIDEAERFERLIIMDRATLIADDAPGRLRAQLGARLLTVPDRGWSPPASEQTQWTRTAHGWMLMRDGRAADDADGLAERAAELIRAGVTCTVAPPTLADVFEHLTGRALDEDAAPAAGAESPQPEAAAS